MFYGLRRVVESLRREFTVLERRRAFLKSELSRLNISVENIRKSLNVRVDCEGGFKTCW